MTPEVAALMVTNPNTLGLFESHIARIAEIVHAGGGLVYGDGANLNALLGIARPGDLGTDVMHFNLHKTFSTPHGGGGPGAGPIGVKNCKRDGEGYDLDSDFPHSIGRLHANFGNVAMAIRAYAYLRSLGPEGLRRCAEMAVLNANYLLARLRPAFHVPYDRPVMHECVLSDHHLGPTGVTTMDVAKRLIDYGYHPPTIYFPLIVDRAHREREPGGAGSLRRSPPGHRAGGPRRPRSRAIGAAPHAPFATGRDPSRPNARSAMATRGRLIPVRIARWLARGTWVAWVAAFGCIQDDGSRFNPIEFVSPRMDEDDERRIGMEFDRELHKQVNIIHDPVVAGFLNDLGQSIAETIEPQPFIYRFRVVEAPSLNAFAVPGGYVYFHSGTLLAAGSVDELAGVMGHEIAHVKARHVARMCRSNRSFRIWRRRSPGWPPRSPPGSPA
jgi:hypothetical protein